MTTSDSATHNSGSPEKPAEWNSSVYHRVSEPQFQWGLAVIERLPLVGHETILDAGCGSGRLTAALAARLPQGRVIGVDLSENMVRTAREHLPPALQGRVQFVKGDVLELPFARAFDGIFSTAAFHWVLDHDRLFASLFRALRPGGWLDAQCGGGPNLAAVLERVSALAASPAYAAHTTAYKTVWEFASAETTTSRLAGAGFTEIVASVEEAPVFFDTIEEYREFMAAVILRSLLAGISSPEIRESFLEEVAQAAARDTPPFRLDYWRLNMRARRPLRS